jgi:hypothetical protein
MDRRHLLKIRLFDLVPSVLELAIRSFKAQNSFLIRLLPASMPFYDHMLFSELV